MQGMLELWFWGYTPKENAHVFLRSFCRIVEADDARVRQFGYYLWPGSIADGWWEELPAEKKQDWGTLKSEFTKRWPPNRLAKKTKRECVSELRGMMLSEGDLFRKEDWGGCEVYSHFAWASRMEELVRGAGLWDADVYMDECVNGLPQAVRMVVRKVDSWGDLLRGVRDLDIEELVKAMDVIQAENMKPASHEYQAPVAEKPYRRIAGQQSMESVSVTVWKRRSRMGYSWWNRAGLSREEACQNWRRRATDHPCGVQPEASGNDGSVGEEVRVASISPAAEGMESIGRVLGWLCHRCRRWINYGSDGTTFRPLTRHQEGKRCKELQGGLRRYAEQLDLPSHRPLSFHHDPFTGYGRFESSTG
ncbi:hypothetical protein NMY22_g14257 [Coprinellus aureogranulatus]|nr:hypothetical protein NMY22_g14257 [Coprinellus aureogranulatus]